MAADEGDDLDDEEREALHAELAQAWEGAKRREDLLSTRELIGELRRTK